MGTALHGKDTMEAADLLRNKHASYTNFMVDVAKYIIESYIIHRMLINEYDEEKVEDKHLTKYRRIEYPNISDCVKIKRTHTLRNSQKFQKSNEAAQDVENFLAELDVSKPDLEIRHITWLGLYIPYRCRGGRKPIPDPTRACFSKATLDKQLMKFQHTFRNVVHKISLEEDAKRITLPMTSRKDALIHVGILGKHQGVKINVHVNNTDVKL